MFEFWHFTSVSISLEIIAPLPFLPVSLPSMTLAVFHLFSLSYFVHVRNSVFLAETESTRSLRDTSGEDYMQMVFGQEFKNMDTCQQICFRGTCREDTSKTIKPYVCLPGKLGAKEPPTTTAPMTDNCVRTPRNSRKIKHHKWGHWVRGLRTPRNFCCSRGRNAGDMVRTPRCCKPRTPRTPRACD